MIPREEYPKGLSKPVYIYRILAEGITSEA